MLHILDLCVTVKHLDEVIVAVVGHLELVVGELEVDLLTLLSTYDPGAVQGNPVGLGVVDVLLRYVGTSFK